MDATEALLIEVKKTNETLKRIEDAAKQTNERLMWIEAGLMLSDSRYIGFSHNAHDEVANRDKALNSDIEALIAERS